MDGISTTGLKINNPNIKSTADLAIINNSDWIIENYLSKKFPKSIIEKPKTNAFLLKKLFWDWSDKFFQENPFPSDVLLEWFKTIIESSLKDIKSVPASTIRNFWKLLSTTDSYELCKEVLQNSSILKKIGVWRDDDVFSYLVQQLPIIPIEFLRWNKLNSSIFFRKFNVNANWLFIPNSYWDKDTVEYNEYTKLINEQIKSIWLTNLVTFDKEICRAELIGLKNYLSFNDDQQLFDIFKKGYETSTEKNGLLYLPDVDGVATINNKFLEYIYPKIIKLSYEESMSSITTNIELIDKMIDSYNLIPNKTLFKNIIGQIDKEWYIYSDKILSFIDSNLLVEKERAPLLRIIKTLSSKTTYSEIDIKIFNSIKDRLSDIINWDLIDTESDIISEFIKIPLFSKEDKQKLVSDFFNNNDLSSTSDYSSILVLAKEVLWDSFEKILFKRIDDPELINSFNSFFKIKPINQSRFDLFKTKLSGLIEKNFTEVYNLWYYDIVSLWLINDVRFLEQAKMILNSSEYDDFLSIFKYNDDTKEFYKNIINSSNISSKAIMNLPLKVLVDNVETVSEKLWSEEFIKTLLDMESKKSISKEDSDLIYKKALSNPSLKEEQLINFPLKRIVEHLSKIIENKSIQDIKTVIDLINKFTSWKQQESPLLEELIARIVPSFWLDKDSEKSLVQILINQSKVKNKFPLNKSDIKNLTVLSSKSPQIFERLMKTYCSFKNIWEDDIWTLIALYNETKFDFVKMRALYWIDIQNVLKKNPGVDLKLMLMMNKRSYSWNTLINSSDINFDLNNPEHFDIILNNFSWFSFTEKEKKIIANKILEDIDHWLFNLRSEYSRDSIIFNFMMEYIFPVLDSKLEDNVKRNININIKTLLMDMVDAWFKILWDTEEKEKNTIIFDKISTQSKLGFIKTAMMYNLYDSSISALFPEEAKLLWYTDQIFKNLNTNPDLIGIVWKEVIWNIIAWITRFDKLDSGAIWIIKDNFKYLSIPDKIATMDCLSSNKPVLNEIVSTFNSGNIFSILNGLSNSDRIERTWKFYKKKDNKYYEYFSREWRKLEDLDSYSDLPVIAALSKLLPDDITDWLTKDKKWKKLDNEDYKDRLLFSSIFFSENNEDILEYKDAFNDLTRHMRTENLLNDFILPITKKIWNAKFVMKLSKITSPEKFQNIIDELKKNKVYDKE